MKITVVREHQPEAAQAAHSGESAANEEISFCLFCSGNCAAVSVVDLATSAVDGHDELRPPLS
ncbi:hypothetical protein [Actinacidiphila acididurans]|jgi:hypothetical protein|uniref:Uncharacterized protein n=1 Tax=Actinacidiphila acididurans TaxID=2784346 RepID=A0ABS2U4E4_9ACTN|nr:hypothetical protein [Actinacidiphila acididurans]MBM9510471.1 hypothetical protein [Actinacidiphila acididurans]